MAPPRGIDVCVRGGIILPMTPLQVRPGARFTCHADGLCCSDIHVLGPVEEAELVPLRPLGHDLGQRIAGRDASVKGWAFRVVETGACPFLQADNLCRVHATLGPQSKPATCRLFPFYLVGTPSGVRVSTSHRCTCRSIGQREPLDPARAREELGMGDRELPLAWSAPARIALDAERDVSFAEWAAREARLLERLNAGNGLPALLGSAFPALRKSIDSWEKVAARFCRPSDATGFEQAKAWIGEAIRAHVGGTPIVERPRPWARFLPRVAARTTPADSRDAILADWLGDELWGLGWARWGTFEQARMDFATRAAIVAALESAFSALGTPGVIAIAEAILVVDAIVHSPHWDAVARALPRRP